MTGALFWNLRACTKALASLSSWKASFLASLTFPLSIQLCPLQSLLCQRVEFCRVFATCSVRKRRKNCSWRARRAENDSFDVRITLLESLPMYCLNLRRKFAVSTSKSCETNANFARFRGNFDFQTAQNLLVAGPTRKKKRHA